jgi:hypothetical protein
MDGRIVWAGIIIAIVWCLQPKTPSRPPHGVCQAAMPNASTTAPPYLPGRGYDGLTDTEKQMIGLRNHPTLNSDFRLNPHGTKLYDRDGSGYYEPYSGNGGNDEP